MFNPDAVLDRSQAIIATSCQHQDHLPTWLAVPLSVLLGLALLAVIWMALSD
jgi:hypothetical protein